MELSGVNDMAQSKGNLSEEEYDRLSYQAQQLISTLAANGSSKEEIRVLFQQLPDYIPLMNDYDKLFSEAYYESK